MGCTFIIWCGGRRKAGCRLRSWQFRSWFNSYVSPSQSSYKQPPPHRPSRPTAGLCSSSLPPEMRSSLPATMLNTSLRRVARHCPNCNRPSTTTPITASFSSHTHQRRHSSSKRPVPPSSSDPSIQAAQVKAVATKNKSEIQAKRIPNAPAVKDAEASGTIDVTKKRPGTESRLSHRRELRSKKDYSNEWLLNVPSVAPTNHLKREGTYTHPSTSSHQY